MEEKTEFSLILWTLFVPAVQIIEFIFAGLLIIIGLVWLPADLKPKSVMWLFTRNNGDG